MFGDALNSLTTFLTFNAPRVTAFYALALAFIFSYWMSRIWRESRRERLPLHAWWSVPGLLLLLFAPIQEQPTFFALGAFALLFAEFWPRAYRKAKQRPGWVWPTLGLLLGLGLLGSAVDAGGSQKFVFAVTLALVLSCMAALSSVLAWRDPPPLPSVNTYTWPRWAAVTVPEWPDLSVTVTSLGAELKNVSSQPLALSGWSPARLNGWLLVRDPQGQPLHTLNVGQSAFLPLDDLNSGIRVWYQPADAAQVRLFRADWTPQRYQQGRVLN